MKVRQKKLQALLAAKQETQTRKLAKQKEKEKQVEQQEKIQSSSEAKRLIRRPKIKTSGLSQINNDLKSQTSTKMSKTNEIDCTSLPSIIPASTSVPPVLGKEKKKSNPVEPDSSLLKKFK